LKVLSTRNPELDWFVRHNDEIFHAGWLLIEHHYLKYYGTDFINFMCRYLLICTGASFSENFYGLKRQRVNPLSGVSGGGKDASFEMSGKDKLFSLLLLVFRS
jgi:hypothetical protein